MTRLAVDHVNGVQRSPSLFPQLVIYCNYWIRHHRASSRTKSCALTLGYMMACAEQMLGYTRLTAQATSAGLLICGLFVGRWSTGSYFPYMPLVSRSCILILDIYPGNYIIANRKRDVFGL